MKLRKIRSWGLTALLAGAAWLPVQAQPLPQGYRSASDREVREAVAKAVLYESFVPANDVDVTVTDGIVTLTGEADNLLARERAGKAAEQTRGVRAVINRISVAPVDRRDDVIRADVERAFRYDPATRALTLTATVVGGVATVKGTVDSWQQRNLATQIAKKVKGVREVRDELQLELARARPDDEIAAEVRRTLEMDAWVDAGPIHVEVENGVVELSGGVGSLAEKLRAFADAWTAGVYRVNFEHLAVQPWRDPAAKRDRPVQKSDDEIRDALSSALQQDPRLRHADTQVAVVGGVVRLWGSVPTLKAKQAAAGAARSTAGVRQVNNLLKVQPREETADREIASAVEAALQRNVLTDSGEIAVEVDRGRVVLQGVVESHLAKAEAESIAQSAAGVTEVRNRVAVQDGTMTHYDFAHDPLWDYDPDYRDRTFSLRGSAFDPSSWPSASDAEIRAHIEEELFWNPFVDEANVAVTVADGTATLHGTVDSFPAARAATEDAYQGGAHLVITNLAVSAAAE